MSFNPQAAYSVFLESIRSIVREEVDEIQRASEAKNSNKPPLPNRIGGVALAMEVTGLAKQSVYNLAHQGTIPHYKPFGKLVFHEDELREWMLTNRRGTHDERVSVAHQHVVRPKPKKGGAR